MSPAETVLTGTTHPCPSQEGSLAHMAFECFEQLNFLSWPGLAIDDVRYEHSFWMGD